MNIITKMSKIDIALEIESLQKKNKPNRKRIEELQAKLHNPMENNRVRSILAKKDQATRSEVLYLVNKGVTVKEIAENMGVPNKVIFDQIKTKRGKYLTSAEVDRRFYEAIKLLKSDLQLAHCDAAEIVGLTSSVLSKKIKHLKIEIPPRDNVRPEVREAINLMNEDLTLKVMEASRLTGATLNQLAYRIKIGEIRERVKA